MAELRQNTWSLNAWYEQDYAGNVDYTTTVNAGFVWGRNANGQLGQNNRTTYSSPIQIPGNWSTLEGGSSCTHGVKSDGTLWAWGRNDQGRLGVNQPTSSKYSSPVQIPGTTWSTNRNHLDNRSGVLGAAIKTDGTLWTWGYGTYGRLGQNSNSSYSSPRQVPGTAWNVLSTSYNGQFCIRTDGTLWAWGNNTIGQLGQNNQKKYSSPVQIPGSWSKVSENYFYATGAIKTGGTLWMWGRNGSGHLGQNNRTEYSSPRQVPGTTWAGVSVDQNRTMATKTDGTLWGWGEMNHGCLGLNQSSVTISSPVQIPGTTWHTENFFISDSLVAAMKTDGTLWTWGSNSQGGLGQNNKTKYSSPTQVPGTAWADVYQGNSGMMAIQTAG